MAEFKLQPDWPNECELGNKFTTRESLSSVVWVEIGVQFSLSSGDRKEETRHLPVPCPPCAIFRKVQNKRRQLIASHSLSSKAKLQGKELSCPSTHLQGSGGEKVTTCNLATCCRGQLPSIHQQLVRKAKSLPIAANTLLLQVEHCSEVNELYFHSSLALLCNFATEIPCSWNCSRRKLKHSLEWHDWRQHEWNSNEKEREREREREEVKLFSLFPWDARWGVFPWMEGRHVTLWHIRHSSFLSSPTSSFSSSFVTGHLHEIVMNWNVPMESLFSSRSDHNK